MYDKSVKIISSIPYLKVLDDHNIPEEISDLYIKEYRKQMNVDILMEYLRFVRNNNTFRSNYHRNFENYEICNKINFLKKIYGEEGLGLIMNLSGFIELFKLVVEDNEYTNLIEYYDFIFAKGLTFNLTITQIKKMYEIVKNRCSSYSAFRGDQFGKIINHITGEDIFVGEDIGSKNIFDSRSFKIYETLNT